MGFYFEDEHSQDMYRSLKGLVNNNDGFFKSKKHSKFIESKRNFDPENNMSVRSIERGINGLNVIIANARVNHDESKTGFHRGLILIDYIFLFDEFGVKELWQVNQAMNSDKKGYHITKVDQLFERDPELDLPEFEEEESVSNYFGEVGQKYIKAVKLDFRTSFETKWGNSYIYKFIDADDNVLVWFTSSFKEWEVGTEMDIKFKVKDHDEYKGTKQTKISYVKEVV